MKIPANSHFVLAAAAAAIAVSACALPQRASPTAHAAPVAGSAASIMAPPPAAPFTDFRYEAPGIARQITVVSKWGPHGDRRRGARRRPAARRRALDAGRAFFRRRRDSVGGSGPGT